MGHRDPQVMTSHLISPIDLGAFIDQEIGVSSWITLGQERIDAFAGCTEDRQWIHVDAARAERDSPFGGTIAHGFLTLSLLSPTAIEVLLSRVRVAQAVNYGLDKVRFLAPVLAGRRVRNRISVVAVVEKGDGRVLVSTGNVVEIEGKDKPALVATAQILLMS